MAELFHESLRIKYTIEFVFDWNKIENWKILTKNPFLLNGMGFLFLFKR